MSELGSFVWGIADILRGPFKPKEYGTVILPFTTLRRLECAMEPHRAAMREILAKAKGNPVVIRSQLRQRTATAADPGLTFWNSSPYTLATALADVDNLAANLIDYINGFSADVDMFKHFNKTGFEPIIRELDSNQLLVLVTRKFSEIDLSPSAISNAGMGDLFEELIYKFAEASNDKAGDFYTPRDAIRLLVDLVFAQDTDGLSGNAVRSVYDPTAGTGGMLSVAEEHVRDMNPDAELRLFAQEINGDSYAICKADMLIKGQDVANVKKGDTLAKDEFAGTGFDYILSNPPFGQDWEAAEKVVRAENAEQSFVPGNRKQRLTGRFGAGLPAIGDGAMLFLQHAASKMRPVDEFGRGGRVGIVLSGSPLFNGAAGSGPSNIRGWLLENDLVEAIVGLPNDMFYNTGIGTYLWLLDNAKATGRQGKVRLVDATGTATKMRKSLGDKRVEISDRARRRIVRAAVGEDSPVPAKDFDNLDFAYWQVTVERPFQWSFQVTPQRIEAVEAAAEDDRATARAKGEAEATKAKTEPAKESARAKHVAQKLGAVKGLPAALRTFGAKTYDSRAAFLADLGKHLASAGIALTAPQRTDLWKLLGEHDLGAQIERNRKGEPEADVSLRDTELIPFGWNGHEKSHGARDETITAYLAAEVLPHAPGAWVDATKTKVGYEIPFARYFYKYVPPRPLAEIDADLEASVARIMILLKAVEG